MGQREGVMFFDKPFHDITFQDVVAFCERQLPEGKQLDYKYLLPKNYEKFAKVIASFANAMGGLLIIGVQDDRNDKPRPPFAGIPYHEKLRNTIEDIIQVYIDPIVFVDINVCVNKAGDRMFVLIQIPQSNLTPHLVGKLKRAYIRTGQSSRPEAIVHPEKLPWLLDHRKKSERLRHILYDKAESHFDNYLKTLTVSAEGEVVCTLSIMPFYPDEPLTNYKKLPALMNVACTRAEYGTMADTSFPLMPVQDGAAIISNQRGIYKMTEFNAYGLVMNKQIISSDEIVNGHAARTLHLEKIAENMALFLMTARKYAEQLTVGGNLYFRLKMNNTRAARVLFNNKPFTALEDYVRMDKTLSLQDLQNNLPEFLETLLHETAWALGVQVSAEDMRLLLKRLLNGVVK